MQIQAMRALPTALSARLRVAAKPPPVAGPTKSGRASGEFRATVSVRTRRPFVTLSIGTHQPLQEEKEDEKATHHLAEPPRSARAVALARHENSLPPPVTNPTATLESEVWTRDSDDEKKKASPAQKRKGKGSEWE